MGCNDLNKLFKMKAIEMNTSISKVAKEINMTNQSVYSQILHGNPTIKSISRLAEGFNCDIEIRLIDRNSPI